MGRRAIGKRRQGGEGLGLRFAVNACGCADRGRAGRARPRGNRRARGSAAARSLAPRPPSTMKPPLSNAAMPMADRAPRSTSSPSSRGAVRRALRAASSAAPMASASCVPEPRPAWAGMAALISTLVGAVERQGLGEAAQRPRARASLSGPSALKCAAALQHELGARAVDGEADAAEAPPEAAVEVEEAEMQPRGRDDAHGRRPERARASASGLPLAGGSVCVASASGITVEPTDASVHDKARRGQYGGRARKAHAGGRSQRLAAAKPAELAAGGRLDPANIQDERAGRAR